MWEPITYIYALVDPNSLDVRYVGKSDTPQRRFTMHMRAYPCAKNPRKERWIKQLKDRGQEPLLRILEAVRKAAWRDAERHWIVQMRSQGMPLTNLAEGGHEPPRGEESDRRRGASIKKQWATLTAAERAQRLSAAHAGSRAVYKQWAETGVPEDVHERCRRRQLGRKHTDATKEKIAAAHRNKVVSEETRRRLSESHKGKVRSTISEAGRERLRQLALERWSRLTPEERHEIIAKGKRTLAARQAEVAL